MKLTRRGYGAVALVVLAVVLGWGFGARSLNAVAAPALAALLVGAVMLSRAGAVSAELSTLEPGFPGETRTLTLSLSGPGQAAVSLSPPAGVDGGLDSRRVTLPDTLTCELELAGRGMHTVGPPTVFQRDPLGLLEQPAEVAGRAELVVYPEPYDVTRGSLAARLFLDELETERQEFDRLREYRPSDSLRHVHWKSSAKHDDFLVMEFAPSKRDETVTIAATAPKGEVDEMARLAATVVDLALDGGYSVELATPDGHVPPGQGGAHRESLMRLLARTRHGTTAPVRGEADVEIAFDRRELSVRVGDREYTPGEFLGNARGTAVDSPRDWTEVSA